MSSFLERSRKASWLHLLYLFHTCNPVAFSFANSKTSWLSNTRFPDFGSWVTLPINRPIAIVNNNTKHKTGRTCLDILVLSSMSYCAKKRLRYADIAFTKIRAGFLEQYVVGFSYVCKWTQNFIRSDRQSTVYIVNSRIKISFFPLYFWLYP